MSKIQIFTKNTEQLQNEIIERYNHLLNERRYNKPIAYITNQCEFMSLDFYVDKNVLIPRPDTEILVEAAMEYIRKKEYKTILEIGTGSGCIAISIAYYIKRLYVIASDISMDALRVARKNACKNDCREIAFVCSNLFKNINDNVKADIIISNPPYIKTGEIETLLPNVKDYEPHGALDGGKNGLDFYIKIINEADSYLSDGGMIFFEIGYDQAEAVKGLFYENGYTEVEVIKDLTGHDRVVKGCKQKCFM